MKDIVNQLDRVANTLEKKGLVKEALEIDIIANTIEAFDINRSVQGRTLSGVIDFLRSGKLNEALTFLKKIDDVNRAIVNEHGEKALKDGTFPAKEYSNAIETAKNQIEKQDVEGAIRSITQAQDNLRDIAFFINQSYGMTDKPFKPLNTPTQQRTPQNINPQRNAPGDMFFSGPKKRGLFQKLFK